MNTKSINIFLALLFATLSGLLWVMFFTKTAKLQFWMGLFWTYQLPAIVFALFAFMMWGIILWQERRIDDELRCRKCRHILRGLSEPRCPECGQHI